jgi:mannose-1-phosphate guanylyltransferase
MKIVIFCGGYGTRMWPISRKSSPKQFFPLIHGKSFFEITVARFKKKFKPEDIFVSTEEIYKDVLQQAPEIPKENVIGEPERRDNLGAIGLAAAIINKRFPNEVIFFSWCDHIIEDEDKFLDAVIAAGEYAKETGKPVSIDQMPQFPSIHNGWVKIGNTVDEFKGHRIAEIEQHVEKPDLETAKKFFRSDNYLIHTGYDAWRLDVLLENYKKHAPEVYAGLVKIIDSMGTNLWETELYREYHKFEKQSIDYGIFQKIPAKERVTIPLDFGWKDSGTWQLFYESFATKENPNVTEGSEITLIDSSGNLIIGAGKKMISVIGLSNIAVIDTADGLLVCDLNKTAQVKDLFTTLEKEKPEYVE